MRDITLDKADEHYMAHALRLARRGWYNARPNPRVGCVIVRDGQIIGEGWHAKTGAPHAEVNALQDAQQRHGGAAGASVYVTLEPCCHHGRTPPCTQALIAAGVSRVIVGAQDANARVAGAGIAELQQAGLEVTVGVLAQDCADLNPGFSMRMTQARPRVRLKMAMSLDGRTAAASGQSQWITGPQAREDVHRLRAESGAILTGVGTALADDPSLNVRLPGDWPQPMRVVLDTHLRLPPGARMLSLSGQTVVYCAAEPGAQWDALTISGAQIRRVDKQGTQLDLQAVMQQLAGDEINDVLVECGPTLGGSLLAAGLVDELLLYIAPQIIGDTGRGLFTLPGAYNLDDRVELTITDTRAVGRDWRITAIPQYPSMTAPRPEI